jgi:hypothetical protein
MSAPDERWHHVLPDLWRVRGARRVATTLIGPFVERSRARLGGIPDAAWSDPYVVGFLGMLITVVARHSHRRIGSHGLGLVQTGVWSALTGLSGEAVGEEICLLDSCRNARFDEGCANAQDFFALLTGGGLVQREPAGDVASGPVADLSPFAALALDTASGSWVAYFDDQLRLV